MAPPNVNQPLPAPPLPTPFWAQAPTIAIGWINWFQGITAKLQAFLLPATGTPQNTATPAGYVQASVNGQQVWIPYYQ